MSFQRTLDKIIESIHGVLKSAAAKTMSTNGDALLDTNSPMGKGKLGFDNDYIGNNGLSLKHLFLVGGFAESPILQEAIRKEFGRIMNVVIPQVVYRNLKFIQNHRIKILFTVDSFPLTISIHSKGASVAVLRGAVLYGLDPSVVHVRRAVKTYGIGVIEPFIHGLHPNDKVTEIHRCT